MRAILILQRQCGSDWKPGKSGSLCKMRKNHLILGFIWHNYHSNFTSRLEKDHSPVTWSIESIKNIWKSQENLRSSVLLYTGFTKKTFPKDQSQICVQSHLNVQCTFPVFSIRVLLPPTKNHWEIFSIHSWKIFTIGMSRKQHLSK